MISMRFTCLKEDLSNAISSVSRVVSNRSANTALEGILVHAGLSLQLSGYNMETGITIELDSQISDFGRCVMPCPLFGEIIRKMPDGEDVTVQMDDDLKVTITSGIVRFQIMAGDAIDYPELPTVNEKGGAVMQQSQLHRLVDGTLFCVSDDPVKPIITGCLVEIEDTSITMVGLDGYRIAVRKEILEQPCGLSSRFVVSGGGLREVSKLLRDVEDEVRFQYDDRYIVFHIGGAVVICRQLSGNYLDYKKAIRRFEDIRLCANTQALQNSVERMRLMTSDVARNPVHCVFGDGEVELRTTSTVGNVKDICSYAGDGKGLTVGFNSRYLLEALKAVEDDEVMLELQSGNMPLIFAPAEAGCDKFLYLILPVRLGA